MKNSLNKKYFLCLCSLLISLSLSSQSLASRVEGLKNFAAIQSISEAYYDSIAQGLRKLDPADRKYKHWKREEHFLQMHLDKEGDVTNYVEKNLEANELLDREQKSASRSTVSNWTHNGPTGHFFPTLTRQLIGLGRVDRITFHPTIASTIMVGTPSSGAWKTTNGGLSWYCVNDNMPAMGVSGIQYSKTNPNVVYMLTGCGDGGGSTTTAGVFKSIDGGETWSKTGAIDSYIGTNFTGYEIAVNDVNDNKVVIATSNGLIATSDGGVTWTNLGNISGAPSNTFFDVAWKPNSPNVFYGASGKYLIRINDITGSFVEENYATFPIGRKSIAVSPADANFVYVISGPATGPGSFTGCWLSLNSGSSFTLMSNSPNVWGGEGGAGEEDQSGYDNCFTAHPTDATKVVMGGLVTNLSIDGGQTWNSITTYGAGSSSSSYVHPDIHDVKINPLNGYLYNCNDGGIYVSTNLGSTWTNITTSLNTTQFYHMANYNSDKNYFAGGTQDNGIKYRAVNSTLMDHFGSGDGYQPAFNPIDPTMFYISVNNGFYRISNSGTVNTFVPVPDGLQWFMEVVTHPTDGNTVYVGAPRFHISQDQGATWNTVNVPAHNAISVAPSNGARMYTVGSGGQQVHQINGLSSSTFITLHDKPGFPDDASISDITVHPTDENKIAVTSGGYISHEKLFISVNGGLSWTNKTHNLPNIPIWCATFAANGDLFAGSEIGVFYLPNGTTQWLPFRNNMPNVSIRDIHIFEADNLVRVATYGRGVWQSPKPDGTCLSSISSFPNPLQGYHFTEVSNTIQLTNTVSGGLGTNVYLKAGSYIDFLEGFEAKDNGTLLKAYISPCGTNLPSLGGG